MASYNQWANRDLFAAVRALPQGEVAKQRQSLFKNILNTLNRRAPSPTCRRRTFPGVFVLYSRCEATAWKLVCWCRA